MAQPLETVIGGKYEILQKIREGGMGSIYKVRHRLLDEIRIVKVLRSQLAMDETLQQRFQNEAKIAIRLRHPNIAHLYDYSVSREGKVAFIVMEYIDGVTLQELIAQNGAPTPGLAVEIASQFAGALSYLHSQGFVHRDIASDNLMLTTDYEGGPLVKLIDLGIAKGPEENLDLTQTGVFMGKVRYSPPEVFSAGGAASLDERGDVYSLGVLLYELFTGENPFKGSNFSEIVAGHLFRPPRPFEETDPDGNVPAGLRELTLTALEKEPDKRFGSVDEIVELLRRHAQPVETHRTELARALEATSHIQTIEAAPAADGSTQNRLDREFGVGDPSSHDEGTREMRLQAVAHAARAIRQRTELGDLDNAHRDLELAVSLYGEHPELEHLRAELERRSSARSTREMTSVSGDRASPAGGGWRRLASPPALFTVAAVLLVGAGALWLSSRPRRPAAADAEPAPAIFVERAPRWGGQPGESDSLPAAAEIEVPPPAEPPSASPPPAPAGSGEPEPPPESSTEPPEEPAPIQPEPAPEPAVAEPAEETEVARGELYGPDPGVVPPALVRLPPVVYPDGFKTPRSEMYVMIDVLVGEDGKVITARATPGESAKKRYREVAMETAQRAVFRPATKAGVIGKMWASIRVPLPAG